MTADDLLWMIGRATLFTSASAIVVAVLLGVAKVRAPRLHRAVWLLVVLQAWLLVPLVWEVERPAVERAVAAVDADSTRIVELNELPSVDVAPSPVLAAEHLSFAQAMIVIWFAGGAVAAVSYVWRYLRFARQLRNDGCNVAGPWQLEWERQWRAAGLRPSVELRITQDYGPLVCIAPWHFLVLVPRGLWESLARRERNAILRHEIAHLVRGDLWWSLAIRVLALPQWFNPLVWLAVRRFDEAGEWACDDWVSRGKRDRELTFARSLVAAAEYATTRAPGTASAQGGTLARRVRRLVSTRKEDRMFKKLLVFAPLAAIVMVQLVRIEFVMADEPSEKPAEKAAKTISYVEITPPEYVIEPPDVLTINAVRLVPRAPYRAEPFDSLLVRVLGALPDQPIQDAFSVDAEGKIDLGPTYGRIEVAGLTVDEAKEAIKRSLEAVLQSPEVSVSLVSSAAPQQVVGEHLVGPDGRVNLGTYGTVYVTGMTIGEATKAIEKRLSEYLKDPRVTVDVSKYSSKKYYVIMRDLGKGDQVVTGPITGNETVLDALALVDEALKQSSTKIWISRPPANGVGASKILPVRWDEIVDGTSTTTNYQLLPCDRLFIVGDRPREESKAKPAIEIEPSSIKSSRYSPESDESVKWSGDRYSAEPAIK
jgi:polysaccharide export outer membrane protein